MSKADQLASQPDYLKTFSLKCEPFANDLDGRFFYGGSALMQRLDLLTHLTQFGDAVILVSGPPGSGKTTLLSRFAGQANKQWRLCLINGDEFGYFQQRLADTLRIDASDDELQMLEQWVNQTDTSQLLVIVIDNAEQLPQSAFERLCILLNQPFADRIRLILFGSPQAQKTLKQALDQKSLSCTTQLLEVPRLSEEETASYLMYRLAVAGYSGESPFTATEVRGICKAADGRPGDINLLARESLLERQARVGSKRSQPKKPARRLGAAVWGPASFAVIAAALYLGWERLQPFVEPVATESQPRTLTEPPAPPAMPLTTGPQPPEPDGAEETAPATLPAPQVAAVTPAPRPVAPPADTTPPPADTAGDMPVAEVAQPLPTPPATVAAKPDAVIPVAPPADDTPPTTAAAEPPAEQPTQPQEPQKPVDIEVSPATAERPELPPATGPHRENWLLQQEQAAYTLQLLGSRSEKSILEYIKRHKLDPDNLAYYRGNYRGSEWYVLVYGIYPDKPAALARRDALPAKIRKAKPWPRTLESVQTAIRDMQ